MHNNVDIITDFVSAWSRLDPSELADFFAEDGTYHNMPAGPITGKSDIEKFIRGFTASWTQTDWDILNIAADGDVVYCERLDRTKSKHGDVDLPCFGVFEMRDGKIHVWRDYFDMNTFTKAMN